MPGLSGPYISYVSCKRPTRPILTWNSMFGHRIWYFVKYLNRGGLRVTLRAWVTILKHTNGLPLHILFEPVLWATVYSFWWLPDVLGDVLWPTSTGHFPTQNGYHRHPPTKLFRTTLRSYIFLVSLQHIYRLVYVVWRSLDGCIHVLLRSVRFGHFEFCMFSQFHQPQEIRNRLICFGLSHG